MRYRDYDTEIANHEAAIADLRAEKAAWDALSDDKKLAIALHSTLCHWNHTDGCGWEYEVGKMGHDWYGQTHTRWLDKAMKVRSMLPPGTDNDTIVKIAVAMGGL